MFPSRFLGLLCLSSVVVPIGLLVGAEPSKTSGDKYRQIILHDQPAAYWRFDHTRTDDESALQAEGRVVGTVSLDAAGPRPPEFPLFDAANRAIAITGAGSLRIEDPGEHSPLDFENGDAITLEAWVSPRSLSANRHGYILGKGRTNNTGFDRDNQNYALRLTGGSQSASLSFLFRSRGSGGDWHRWTSHNAVMVGDGWHHVAVTYRFGQPESLRGYVDGEPVSGTWDMGGATQRAPVTDDDELWIGSSMGDTASSTFPGGLDEIALYRKTLTAERIEQRYRFAATSWDVDVARVPENSVLVDVLEGIPDGKTWRFRAPTVTDSYQQTAFGFVGVPYRYSGRGVRADRSDPFLLRAVARVTLPQGAQRILVRCRNASRLYLDDRKIAETAFHSIPSSGHGKVYALDASLAPGIRPLQRGDTQQVVTVEGDGRRHLFRFEMIVGGNKHRPEFGETSVSLGPMEGDFHLLSPTDAIPLTDAGWLAFAKEQGEQLAVFNLDRRSRASREEAEYWNWRHELARSRLSAMPPPKIPDQPSVAAFSSPIDRFLAFGGDTARPTRRLTDLEFLRRVTLDVVGTIPTADEINDLREDDSSGRRARVIDRLLASLGWADHWVGYWQDVLAENPNIVNPTLNNTGPFRWWIYESMLDNKPLDRFVTELVLMEGSAYYGGTAGFALATENDAPMAAKAHIVGQAFLGLEMKCARCHDAPYHDFAQRDLFSLAAMLKRGPQKVPATSSIPGGKEVTRSLLVEVTLPPGSDVAPEWPFPELVDEDLDPGVLREPDDSRERLAALITSPSNQRFSRVIVNRLWHRYFGYGLVEPIDDWEAAEPPYPDLLDYLAYEFVVHGYDPKHVARLILNSQVYQSVASDVESTSKVAPLRRRLSAEQLVDSLFLAAGKDFDAGPMCIDVDGARPATLSLNLGEPVRAWQFASLSNERDRPSLALPFAQPFVTAMETFGWRSSRQDPLTVRAGEAMVLQPAVMANGVLSRRISRLSDDSAFTKLALRDQKLDVLIDQVYLRLLTRLPADDERGWFRDLLESGYDSRRREAGDDPEPRPPSSRGTVSWSNHLHPQANVIKTELEFAVRKGDPPTRRLEDDWRCRMEDMIWAITNSPEFMFIP